MLTLKKQQQERVPEITLILLHSYLQLGRSEKTLHIDFTWSIPQLSTWEQAFWLFFYVLFILLKPFNVLIGRSQLGRVQGGAGLKRADNEELLQIDVRFIPLPTAWR